jgi:uncharacterized protein (DUF433 family)
MKTSGVSASEVVEIENLGPWIVRDPGICSGDPTIAGSRIGVHDVVSLARRYRWDLERVRTEELSHLTIDQLNAAVSWYRANKIEVDRILRRRRASYRRLLARNLSPR